MSIQSLAEEIGIFVGAMGKIEKGYHGAKIDTLICIAEGLKVQRGKSPAWLLWMKKSVTIQLVNYSYSR